MDKDDLYDEYDEFGNPMGGGDEEDHNEPGEDHEELMNEGNKLLDEEEQRIDEDQIILYEDKKYYPDMDEVYPGVETLIEEEDQQGINDPLIRHVVEKKFDLQLPVPELTYSVQFLKDMMKNPRNIRNVAVLGHLHHGKTTLIDILVEQTHVEPMPLSFTDARMDEHERKISIKAAPISLVMSDSRDKSYLLNLIDTPGHPNFNDEVCSGLRLADGAVLVVDCIEGCMINTERLIKYVVHEQIPVISF